MAATATATATDTDIVIDVSIEHIIANLGPSKVTVPIKYSRFIQGCKDRESKPSICTFGEHPFDIYERIKGSSGSSKLRESNKTIRSVQPSQQHHFQPPAPQQQQVVSKPLAPCFIESTKDKDGFLSISNICDNTLVFFILQAIDSKVGVLKIEDVHAELSKFKKDLAKNLGSDKQLFKKYGFSRKKTLNLESMQTAIDVQNSDASMTDDIIMYLAKLAKINMCIINSTFERKDVECGDEMSRWLVFKQSSEGYALYSHSEFASINELNAFMIQLHITNNHVSKQGIKNMKIQDLRKLAKLFGIKSSSKADITTSLLEIKDIM